MADDNVRKAAHQAWIDGGVLAFVSLKEENLAQAEPTDELLLPDVDDDGADLLLSIIDAAPHGDHTLVTAIRLASAAVKTGRKRSPLQQRLLYRQTVIAVGILTGKFEDSRKLAAATDKALLGLE